MLAFAITSGRAQKDVAQQAVETMTQMMRRPRVSARMLPHNMATTEKVMTRLYTKIFQLLLITSSFISKMPKKHGAGGLP
ncbi:hypothetical protein ABL78_8522 [Leptomonas seymouri]|uniref:Uncharacterized protein n=1 Tax=Leptomonas seymouri TaxID=5684 RepID=A0A0N1IFW1_LEPSE|nr:hypothetical protein ABL78_8522 [Leptomonas seymouri]|eukprot:KPI82468.1 hypothetical protein ABL78_8522 [Leptomonas seymouri]